MGDLHELTIKELIARIKSREATPSELNVARQMLKDNNIIALKVKESPLGELETILDDFDPVEHTNYAYQ